MSAAPQRKTPWHFAGKSDVGRIRTVNEDAFFCDFERGAFLAVADGVGGLEFGERASAAAVEALQRIFLKRSVPATEEPDFRSIFRKIDAEIEALGEKLVPGFGIATTLDVAVDGGNGKIYFAHIGDAAIFLFRGNEMTLLSEEHTLAAAERRRGNTDFPAAYMHTLNRALGMGLHCEPQVFSVALCEGDRILMATDGIARALTAGEIKGICTAPAGTPESITAALISAANDAGGFDNATAVVAFA